MRGSDTPWSVLIVDDEADIIEDASATLRSKGIRDVTGLTDSREVSSFLAANRVCAIVIDLMMPHLPGIDLIPLLVRDYPQAPVIVVTAVDDVQVAVECMKMGAFDYLLKPVDANRLVSAVQKALRLNSLHDENRALRDYLLNDCLRHPDAFSGIITCSKKMRGIFQYLEAISASRQPVLVTGETGVGKELIARAIHTLSGVGGDFVSVNVAGLDDNVFSDTLFGHRKGAFTGADQMREGLISKACGGTLFLDEIGDLSEMSQIKLLRLLQEQEYYPIGSDALRKSDARIIATTNHDIPQLIGQGKFRRDLYYRLCSHMVEVPPLRERREDLPLLVDYFLEGASGALGREKPTVSPELHRVLDLYRFPGNVRELQGMVTDALARSTSGRISVEHFPKLVPGGAGSAGKGEPLQILFHRFPTISEVEERLISEAMLRTSGNQTAASTLLGITRPTLNKRLNQR